MLKQILDQCLEGQFIHYEDISWVIALGAVMERPVILYGPAGHGKSEMTLRLLTAMSHAQVHVQSFGEGTSEPDLWGGMDYEKLSREDLWRFRVADSFLAAECAIFEELLDAPPQPLLAMKDALTAGCLRKGAQQEPMRTRVLVALTNREPSELHELGPAAEALAQRFPLQHRVAWSEYSATRFSQLLTVAESRRTSEGDLEPVRGKACDALETARRLYANMRLGNFKSVLAKMAAEASSSGMVVAPRLSIYAGDVLRASAAIVGRSEVHQGDLHNLRFLTGFEGNLNDMMVKIQQASVEADAQSKLQQAKAQLHQLMAEASGLSTPLANLKHARKVRSFIEALSQIKLTDPLVPIREGLLNEAGTLIGKCTTAAETQTRLDDNPQWTFTGTTPS